MFSSSPSVLLAGSSSTWRSVIWICWNKTTEGSMILWVGSILIHVFRHFTLTFLFSLFQKRHQNVFNNRKPLRCWFFKFKGYNKKWQDNIIHTIIWQLGEHGTTKCHRDGSTTQNICSFPFWENCPNISSGNLTSYQKTTCHSGDGRYGSVHLGIRRVTSEAL